MRKTKTLTVEFDDGTQELPSSIKVKCNVTGNIKSFHTPYLVRLIKRKYENNWNLFNTTYISKEGRGMKNIEEDEEPSLSSYKLYLVNKLKYLLSRKKNSIIVFELNEVRDVFAKRFPDENINDYI